MEPAELQEQPVFKVLVELEIQELQVSTELAGLRVRQARRAKLVQQARLVQQVSKELPALKERLVELLALPERLVLVEPQGFQVPPVKLVQLV
jgi:hypothetical protein